MKESKQNPKKTAARNPRNPRNAGRKKTRVDGKLCNVYLSNETLAALEPFVKTTGSLGLAIKAAVDALDTPPADIARRTAAIETLDKIRALLKEN